MRSNRMSSEDDQCRKWYWSSEDDQSHCTGPLSHLPISGRCCLLQQNLWENNSNQRIDIRVRTLFSLSAFLAVGVLFNLFNSSITTFSTLSIEFRSFFWGVRDSNSAPAWFVISSKILGTLPIEGGQAFTLKVGVGVIIEILCSGGAPDSGTKESLPLWLWDIGLSICRPSTSPKWALLLSIA